MYIFNNVYFIVPIINTVKLSKIYIAPTIDVLHITEHYLTS